jgi:hypothetical protein
MITFVAVLHLRKETTIIPGSEIPTILSTIMVVTEKENNGIPSSEWQ